MPPIPIGRKGMWTYARGEERISGIIRYRRSGSELPAGRISTPMTEPAMYHIIFRTTNLSWRNKSTYGDFEIREAVVPENQQAHFSGLQLLRAELEGDGEVEIYIVSNTERATMLGVLDTLDRRMINAIVAPVASTPERP